MNEHLPSEYKKSFKDADIRGVYPNEIDEVLAYRVARGFVEHFKLKKIIVGRDMRLSSPALRDAFVRGARESGAEVIDLGLVSTPAVYYASGKYKCHALMITASHNPKEYNGMKLVKPGAVPLTNSSGQLKIIKRVEKNKFKDAKVKGILRKKSILREYKSYVRSKVAIKSPRLINIVVDTGNGMASSFTTPLCEGLPIKIKSLFAKLDGTFPNRASNPTLKKNQTAIIKELKTGKYDLGVAFDGDADRLAFFDEKGRYINSAVIGSLLAKYFLEKSAKEKFIYTVFTSNIYEETIKKYGGKAKRARVGHSYIKELMRKHNAVFGCEHSAHFYFRDNYYADSGILSLLYVLDAFSESLTTGEAFSSLLKEFQQYHQTEEILVPVSDKKAALKQIQKEYKKHKPTKIESFDGVSVTFKDYWFTVKQSVTEDALKFVVESLSKKRAVAEQKKVHAFLKTLQ